MGRIWTVAEMTVRGLVRRKAVLALLFATPLAFYLMRRADHPGQAVRFVVLGLGFTVSTMALFGTTAARSMESRLWLSGYRPGELFLGQLSGYAAIGVGIAVPYLGVIAVDQQLDRLGAVALAMLLTVLIAAPLGRLLGELVPREMEGALLLVALLGVQMLIDPAKDITKLLPFWSARELGTYAIDHTDSGYLYRGAAHGVVTTLVLLAGTGLLTALRLRRRRSIRVVADPAR